MLRAADVLSEIRAAEEFGIKVEPPQVDYPTLTARRDKVVQTLTGGVAGLLRKNQVSVIEGAGSLLPRRRVAVADQILSARTIVLAAGSIKRAIPGVEFGGPVIGTEEAWALERLPSSLAVMGAGASGVEIASAYARLGLKVTLVEALELVLAREDEDISRLVERGLKRQGIRVETTSALERVEVLDDHVWFTHGDAGTDAEWLVIAAGRAADIGGLGLAQAGTVTVAAWSRSSGITRTARSWVRTSSEPRRRSSSSNW
jgi:dihydrolipoamide dehydrogenase